MGSVIDLPPLWVGEWIGIPYRHRGRERAGGLDCWGLVRAVLAERFGQAVPEGIGCGEAFDRAAAAALIRDALPEWRSVPAGGELAGDVLLLRVRGLACHTGVIAARGWMLHTLAGMASACEQWQGPVWGRRVAGVYRWPG